jgi:ribose-phosphate pyrophosphokinase
MTLMHGEKIQYGRLGIVGMPGCENLAAKIDGYLMKWDIEEDGGTGDSTLVRTSCPRFATGEGKGMIEESVRGHDLYILVDVLSYDVKYEMYGTEVPMSPDDHFQDLKRIIAATTGKTRRINVIMPHLYGGRQDCRYSRESMDCAIALKELAGMGVENIITFDAHNARVENAIPLSGFENIRPYYQMIKALLRANGGLTINRENMMVVSPDEGGAARCIQYASDMKLDLGMCYKRRDYTKFVKGRHPILSHEFIGGELGGRDVLLIDDIIASGDSMITVVKDLKERGANRIYIFATFGQFTHGLERFDESYKAGHIERVFTTNLIYQPPELLKREWHDSVDMSKYIAHIIRTLNYDSSLNELINPSEKIKKLLNLK